MPNDDTSDGTLGRIALKRVSRAEIEARNREQTGARRAASAPTGRSNPGSGAHSSASQAGRLVPYLDLFSRLSDDELARLARVQRPTVEGLRAQVDEVNRALERYVDLLPRLGDEELVRLTGASAKTIRFWRLSQPRSHGSPASASAGASPSASAAAPPAAAPAPAATPPPVPTPTAAAAPNPAAAPSHGNAPQSPSSGREDSSPFEIGFEDAPTLYDEPSPDESSTMIIDFD